MGFSVEEKEFTLEKELVESTQYPMMVWVQDSDLRLDELDIDIEEGHNFYKIKYKLVKTDGPMINFLGYMLDTESGYVYMNHEKKKEFVALYNLYDYIEDLGYRVDINYLKQNIEAFKVGFLSAKGFNSALKSHRKRLSVIGKFIDDNSEADIKEEGSDIIKEISDLHFERFDVLLKSKLSYSSEEKFSLFSMMKNIDGAIKFFNSLDEGIERKRNLQDIINIYSDELWRENISGEEKEEYWEKIYQAMSIGGRDVLTTIFRSDVGKTELQILNLHDIVDGYDMDTAVEMVDIINRDKSKVSNEEVRQVEEKIGIKEYLRGANLAHLSKGLKGTYNKERIKDYINNFRVNMSIKDIKSYSLNTFIKGLKSGGNYLNKMLKDIDRYFR